MDKRIVVDMVTCHHCKGYGSIDSEICEDCHGKGYILGDYEYYEDLSEYENQDSGGYKDAD